jgi:YHS domain-containing protein
MSRSLLAVLVNIALGLTAAGNHLGAAGDESAARDIPAAFAPLEYLVGRWHGQGVPKDSSAQQFRGWSETHTWAWIFAQGRPAGLSVSIEGGRVLTAGKLTFDAARKLYRLDGAGGTPALAPVTFEGTLDAAGKLLVLERAEKVAAGSGKTRLSLGPNANFVRYTIHVDRQDAGAPGFRRAFDVGLTKEGESFAGGAAAAERPKCIVTGGAATLTVSFQGQTYPICCTGCRDEFNENPEKYIKKAASMLKAQAGRTKPAQPASSRVSRFEDAFAGDVPDAKMVAPLSNLPTARASDRASAAANKRDATAITKTSEAGKPAAEIAKKPAATEVSKPADRAAVLLRLGQNVEKAGKTSAALDYYRRIVKDFAGTPASKTAAARIKALQKGSQ